LLAVLLALHGLAHLVGTDTALRAAREQIVSSYLFRQDTSVDYLLGHWEVSQQSTLLLLGASWAVVTVGFLIAASWVWQGRSGWRIRAVPLVTTSLVLSVVALPQAWVGVVIDVILLTGLLWSHPWRSRGRNQEEVVPAVAGDAIEPGKGFISLRYVSDLSPSHDKTSAVASFASSGGRRRWQYRLTDS
jgi:hypothetical protein